VPSVVFIYFLILTLFLTLNLCVLCGLLTFFYHRKHRVHRVLILSREDDLKEINRKIRLNRI